MRSMLRRANQPVDENEPLDPGRRKAIALIAGGTLALSATIFGLMRWETDTVAKMTVGQLLAMSEEQKRQLVNSGDYFGIRNATVRLVGQRSFIEPTKVLTQYGNMGSSRGVTEVRYRLSDSTGSIDGYADNRDADFQIPPDEANQSKAGEQFDLVQGILRYNAPSEHPADPTLPTGYFVQIELA